MSYIPSTSLSFVSRNCIVSQLTFWLARPNMIPWFQSITAPKGLDLKLLKLIKKSSPWKWYQASVKISSQFAAVPSTDLKIRVEPLEKLLSSQEDMCLHKEDWDHAVKDKICYVRWIKIYLVRNFVSKVVIWNVSARENLQQSTDWLPLNFLNSNVVAKKSTIRSK